MDHPVFLYRLIPPRRSFPQDITAEETRVMQAHAGFWQGLLAAGQAVAFGPVADPAGMWGLAVLQAADEAAAQALVSNDPALQPGMGFRFELLAMPGAKAR